MVKNWKPSLTLGPTAFLLFLALFTLILIDAVLLPYGAPAPQVVYQTLRRPFRRLPISPQVKKVDPQVLSALTPANKVSVVITLNPPVITLSPSQYRRQIKESQDRVLALFTKGDFSLKERSSAPPALIGDITLAGVGRIGQSTDVLEVSLEKPLPQATPSSILPSPTLGHGASYTP